MLRRSPPNVGPALGHARDASGSAAAATTATQLAVVPATRETSWIGSGSSQNSPIIPVITGDSIGAQAFRGLVPRRNQRPTDLAPCGGREKGTLAVLHHVRQQRRSESKHNRLARPALA